MKQEPDNPPDDVPSLLFRVQSRLCCLPVAYVVETMRPLPVEPFSGAPDPVKGVALIRGLPTPVVGLADLLDAEGETPRRFVTVRAGARQVALAVDAVLGLRDLPVAALMRVPPLLDAADALAVTAIGTLDAELLLVLNAARLVPDSLWLALDQAGTH